MNRRLWALLAVLLLVLAALAVQVAAGKGKGDGKGKDRDDDRGDREGGDDRKPTEGARSSGEDDEDEEEDDKGDSDRRKGKGSQKEAGGPAPSASRASPQDAGLSILPTALPGRVQFSFLVSAAGRLDGADFAADLPDTGRPWTLSGPGASACGLRESGLGLSCSFDGLAPGDVRLVQATSPIGSAPPWELVAEGSVSSAGDARPGNDAARAGVGILLT